MKIVYIAEVDLSENTAPAHHVIATATSMATLGHTVRVIAAGKPTESTVKRNRGVTWFSIWWPKMKGRNRIIHVLLALRLLFESLRSHDLVYLRVSPTSPMILALSLISIPKALEVNGGSAFERMSWRRMFHAVDLILVEQNRIKTMIMEQGGVDSQKVQVHVSPALDEHALKAETLEEARDLLGINPNVELLVHVSGFMPWHAFDLIQAAFDIVSSQRPRARLVLLGDGPEFDRVSGMFAKEVTSGRVTFAGTVPKRSMYTYISASNVCLNTLTMARLQEGNNFGFKFFDYLGAGRPIVQTVDFDLPVDSLGVRFASLVPAENPVALAKAIISILEDPHEANNRAKLGREYLAATRTWLSATESTLGLISVMLAEQRN